MNNSQKTPIFATASRMLLFAVSVRQLPIPCFQLSDTSEMSILRTLLTRSALLAYVKIFLTLRLSLTSVKDVHFAQESALLVQFQAKSRVRLLLIQQNVLSAALVLNLVSLAQ